MQRPVPKSNRPSFSPLPTLCTAIQHSEGLIARCTTTSIVREPVEKKSRGMTSAALGEVSGRPFLALMRGLRLPSLQKLVIVDSDALRLFVSEFTLRREIAVLFRLGVPIFRIFFLVELRTQFSLNARLLDARHDRVLVARQSIHGLLRRGRARDRLGDILPPALRALTGGGSVDAGRRPQLARGAAIELDETAHFRRQLRHRIVPDIALADQV